MRTEFVAAVFALLMAFACGCGSATSRLIVELKDIDPKVRRAAAGALGEATQPVLEPVVTALATASKDSDREVRELALAALGRIGPAAKSSETVIGEALGDREKSVRISAAMALQKIDPANEQSRAVILDTIMSADGPVFLEVGQMGTAAKWAVPTLIKLLSHNEPGIRALAARTLGQIGGAATDAEPTLRQSLKDPNPAVRGAAEKALGKIQDGSGRGPAR
jgi:HEAT repeat protein